VMLGTVIVTVLTSDLARGVLTGVLLSALFFARKVGQVLRIDSQLDADGNARRYTVTGQVFFASSSAFAAGFDFREVLQHVTIDVSGARFWDLSAVGALDKAVMRFRREGATVEVVGLDEASTALVAQLGVYDKPGAAG